MINYEGIYDIFFFIKIMINIVYFLFFENVVNFFIFYCICIMVLESIFVSKEFLVIFFYFYIWGKGWNLKIWFLIRLSFWVVILFFFLWLVWKRFVWFFFFLMLIEFLCKLGWVCGIKFEIFDELSYRLCRWINNYKIKIFK